MTSRTNFGPCLTLSNSVQVTSGAASAVITVPNTADGEMAKYVHIVPKTGVYILPQFAKPAFGSIVLTGQPLNNDTVTVGGTVITWKTSGAAGNQVNIGANYLASTKALADFLKASTDSNIDDCRYYYNEHVDLGTISIVHRGAGILGDAFTLTESSSNLTVSGATLTDGTAAVAATAANSVYIVAGTHLDLYLSGQNCLTYFQETSASIINISAIEVG